MTEDSFDAAVLVSAALEAAGIPYAIGGALAYGKWGIPRGTMDVDLNVFTNESEKVFQVIEGLGFTFDRNMALQRIKDEGMFEAWFKTLRLDVFTPSIPFSDEAAKTRVRVRFGNSEVFVLSAEALSVFKMLFNRPKDLVDLERLLLKQKGHLDVGWVERHLIETVGVDDTRVTTWRHMVASTSELP